MDRICRTPPRKFARMTNANQAQTMNSQQLEISLTSRYRRGRRPVRPCRVPRARWWFSQMRRVVDQAADWTPAPNVQGEQIHLPLVASR